MRNAKPRSLHHECQLERCFPAFSSRLQARNLSKESIRRYRNSLEKLHQYLTIQKLQWPI